jgi:hypothetical protein
MPRILAERIRETCQVVGTGPVLLTGSLAGPWRTFAAALAQGDTCPVAIVSQQTGEWEITEATRVSANTLERAATPYASSRTDGAAVAFTAAADQQVFLTPSASDVARALNNLALSEAARDVAVTAADNAAQDREQTGEDREQTGQDREAVAEDREAVESARDTATGAADTATTQAGIASAAAALVLGDTVDVTGSRAITSADNGKRLRCISAETTVLTLPGDLATDTVVEVYRAPGAGLVTFVGLTEGGVSHRSDQASIYINGTVVVRRESAREGINGGGAYWSIFGEMEP